MFSVILLSLSVLKCAFALFKKINDTSCMYNFSRCQFRQVISIWFTEDQFTAFDDYFSFVRYKGYTAFRNGNGDRSLCINDYTFFWVDTMKLASSNYVNSCMVNYRDIFSCMKPTANPFGCLCNNVVFPTCRAPNKISALFLLRSFLRFSNKYRFTIVIFFAKIQLFYNITKK